MSIRFIYGRAGCGKSTFCINEIKKKLYDNYKINKKDETKRQLILIVPEQLTFQSEKKVINAIGGLGIKNVRVLSFKRMAYTVFKNVGGIAKRRMNSSGKCMLIYKIMDEIRGELKVFTNVSRNKGFVDTIADIITELKRYNVTPELLNETKLKIEENSILYDKLSDISKIYSKFEDILHKGYIDSDDDLTLLYDKLDECTIFDDSEIWIDEFNGFVPQQYAIIEKLLKKAHRINITINMNFEDSRKKLDENDVFSPIKHTENKLRDIAINNGIRIEKDVILNDSTCIRFKSNKDLAYLEKNYFEFPFKPYKEEVKNIGLFKALNIYSEIENVAADILRLCRDKNVRFNEIAVISRNIENYEKIIKVVFDEYYIPYFIDSKKDITGNPIIVLILSSIEVITKNWSYESVFRYLKTGLLTIDKDSIDMLENYILETGIKGKKKWTDDDIWYSRIISHYNLKELINDDYEVIQNLIQNGLECLDMEQTCLYDEKILNVINDIYKINGVRKKVVTHLINFQKKIRGKKTSKYITTALYEFLCDINMPETIENLIEQFKSQYNLQLVNEYGQIWNVVIEIMDQIVEVLGDDKMTLDEYAKVLSIGFSENRMGFIPTSLDQVTVSSVERMKSHDIKYMYLIGINDGVFPSVPNGEGILSDADRIRLREENMELAKDTKSQAFEEQFLVYSAFTIAGEYLGVSYPIADFEGKALRPSIIISRLKALFPKLIEKSDIIDLNNSEATELICREIPAFNKLIAQLHEYKQNKSMNPFWISVYNWFNNNKEWKDTLNRMLDGFKYTNQVKKLPKEKVEKLYGGNKYFSISRLEKYNECPFGYFVRYGLNAKDRKIFNLTPPDIGTFMHNVIDKFSKTVDNNKLRWGELDEKWCRKTIEQNVEECINESKGSVFSNSPKYRYFAERIKKVLYRTIWIIVEHMKRTGFEPMGYEIEFGNEREGYPPIEVELSTGEKIKLIGKIDRVDKLIFGDEQYFRIIDYKSGKKDFKLSDVYYGLQMQLLTYLDAILTNESETNEYPIFPAGVLYFKIDDPMIKTSKKMTKEEIEREIMKVLKMDGLVLSDTEIIREMDREIEGASLIIPAYLKKDGTLGSKSHVATKEQFEDLRYHIRKKLVDSCEEMLEGNIEIRPYKNKDKSPCSYCIYSSICEFDSLMKDNNYKIIRDKKDEEVWKLIEQERINEYEINEDEMNKEDGDINGRC